MALWFSRYSVGCYKCICTQGFLRTFILDVSIAVPRFFFVNIKFNYLRGTEEKGGIIMKNVTLLFSMFVSLCCYSQSNAGNEHLSGKNNGHKYVDLGLSVKWSTCNIGATTPEEYGNYYAWGEIIIKGQYSENNSITYDKYCTDIAGNPKYDAARANWGGTWRLPTAKEFDELKNECTWQWKTCNGVDGYMITGPNGNSIFFPAAGSRYLTALDYEKDYGLYWTSTPSDEYNIYSFSFDFINYKIGKEIGLDDGDLYRLEENERCNGLSIRPVFK